MKQRNYAQIISGTILVSLSAIGGDDIDGSHGTLYVHGTLTESACRLEMRSAWQDIDLGNLGANRLQKPGDRGTGVEVQIQLQDCRSISTPARDERGGGISWVQEQPAVTVRFIGAADADNSELVKVTGIEGVGLRVEDQNGRDIRLGSRGRPLLLASGLNSLNYTITPERTSRSLTAGEFRAEMNLEFKYD
jgi:P pilus assembly protein, pilin FimA